MMRYVGVFPYVLWVGLILGVIHNGWAETSPNAEPLPVTLIPLAKVLQTLERSVPATLISLNDSTLSVEVTGKVTRLLVDVGATVKTGQVLANLDCRDYTHSLNQAKASTAAAKARLKFAQNQWQRHQQLRKAGLLPAEQLEKAQADLDSAQADVAVHQAQLDTANLAVSRCDVTAPFAGQITRRYLQLGQQATLGSPAFQLLQHDAQELSAQLSAEEITEQEKGKQLRFVTDGGTFAVKRRAVVGQIAGNTRTQEVRFSLQEPTKLAVGQSGRLVWQSPIPALPASWLVRRDAQLGIMLAEGNVAKFHPLPNAQEGQPAIVDLPDTVLLIDQNRLRVQHGQTIKVESP